MSQEMALPETVNITKAAVYDPELFHRIAIRAQANYASHLAAGKPVFRVELRKGDLFDAYLAALPEEHRQQMHCSCCRSFLNRLGGLVRISTDVKDFGTLKSVFWNYNTEEDQVGDPVFEPAINTMRKMVESASIGYHFLSDHAELGIAEKGGFEHFSVKNLQVFTHSLKKPHEIVATEQQAFCNLSEFIGKVNLETLNQVTTFFKHDKRLKDLTKWVDNMIWLLEFKKRHTELPQKMRRAYIWLQVATQNFGRVDIKNSPLGTFIKNIEAGTSYEAATGKFLDMTRGDKYMAATVAPKAGTIKTAETIFQKLELASALERRPLMHEEMRCVVWRPEVKVAEVEVKPLFGHLKPKIEDAKTVKPKLPTIDGGRISLKHFMESVLPEAEELQFDGPTQALLNFAGFTTAVHADAKPLLRWDKEDDRNPVCAYSYVKGSPATNWGINVGTKIVAIMTSPENWSADEKIVKPFVFGSSYLTFVMEKGHDRAMTRTPMFAETFREELHEVRSVLDAHFQGQRLTPLAEGQKAVVGIQVGHDFAMLPLLVIKKEANVRYLIDRGM